MDLTTAWCRIESLVEAAGQHIVTIEQGRKRDYARAATEVKKCMAEIEKLTTVATQLSQNVSDRMENNARRSELGETKLSSTSRGGEGSATGETTLPPDAPLIDLTAEDAEGEAEDDAGAA